MEKQIMKDFSDLSTAPVDLQKIRKVVSRHRNSHIALKKVEEHKFRIAAYSDTAYKDKVWLKEWEKFYLTDRVSMEVIGVLEEFPCPSDCLIVMVCEDGKVFAFPCQVEPEDYELHLVANNLKELFDIGLQFPGTERYYRGQFLEDLTKDDWNKVKSSEVMREEDQKHETFLNYMENSLRLQMSIDEGATAPPAAQPVPIV